MQEKYLFGTILQFVCLKFSIANGLIPINEHNSKDVPCFRRLKFYLDVPFYLNDNLVED